MQSKGRPVVSNRPLVSSPPSSYNDFLFASICEEANGMRLSVLSALARRDIDPWEEASRLAAMPKANAASILISTLDLTSVRNLSSSDAEAIATRLVRLLPLRDDGTPTAPIGAARIVAQQKAHWLVWLGFSIAVLFLSQHHQAVTANTGGPAEKSNATSQINGVHVDDASPSPRD
jgi:hypothetical protein